MLAGAAAAALLTFGSAVAPAAADTADPGRSELATDAKALLARAPEERAKLLAALLAAVGDPGLRERLDPEGLAALEAAAKQLGIGLEAPSAPQLGELLRSAELGGRDLPQELADLLGSLSALIGKSDAGVRGALADQVAGDLRTLGIDDLGGLVGLVAALPARDTTTTAPDLPYAPDPSLYGMHDGKLDENDDPPATEPSTAPLAEPSPPPLVAAPDPPLTPEDPPAGGGPFDTGGSPAPAAGGGSGILDDPRAQTAKSIFEHLTLPTSVQQGKQSWGPAEPPAGDDWKRPGGKHYSDPDSAGGETTAAPTPGQLEEILAKQNELKRPVGPNGDGVPEPDASSAPLPPGGGDPTLELHDGEVPATTIAAGSEPLQGPRTAPIDYHQDAEPTPNGHPTGGPDSDSTHEAP